MSIVIRKTATEKGDGYYIEKAYTTEEKERLDFCRSKMEAVIRAMTFAKENNCKICFA